MVGEEGRARYADGSTLNPLIYVITRIQSPLVDSTRRSLELVRMAIPNGNFGIRSGSTEYTHLRKTCAGGVAAARRIADDYTRDSLEIVYWVSER